VKRNAADIFHSAREQRVSRGSKESHTNQNQVFLESHTVYALTGSGAGAA